MKRLKVFLLLLASSLLLTSPARSAVVYTVSFDDPTMQFASYYDPIRSNLSAAGANWSQFITGNAIIDLVVGFDAAIPTANGASTIASFAHTNGAFNVFEQGAAAEVRTGTDPNGATADGRIDIGINYLMNELFFDPDPFLRTATVTATQTDAYSVFLHELGHIFGFNGFINPFTGTYAGNAQSTFDEFTFFDGTDLFFTGAEAVSLYGGLVPLTYGNTGHVGNFSPRPGANLIPDLMNGVVFQRGTRYDISQLDLAILCDIGVSGTCSSPQDVPEPETWLLLLAGLFVLAGINRKPHQRVAYPM